MDDVTRILQAARAGDRRAVDRLVPVVYDELKGVARRRLAAEAAGHTLDTTALVHETYLKLVDQSRVDWQDRAHFFAVAARSMRRVLVDHARRRGAVKRGGDRRRVPLEAATLSLEDDAELLVALDEALDELSRLNERLCRVVECRFFAGMSEEETARALGVSVRTIRRDWVKAKGFLYTRLDEDGRE